MSRSTIAAAIAPITPAVLAVVVPIVSSRSWPFHYELPLLLGFSLFVGYLAFFALGLPLITLLRRRGRLTMPALLATGLLVGAVVGAMFIAGLGLTLGTLRYTFSSLSALAGIAAWGGGYGFATSLVYGLIAGRPNNSFKPKPLRGSA